MPGRRQFDALLAHLLAEEAVGDLHQHACTVAHQRIGPDGAAMGEVFEHEQTVFNDLVRLHALHLGDEADAAGIVLVSGVVEALGFRQTGNLRVTGAFDGRAIRLGGHSLLRHRWREVRHHHVLRSLPQRVIPTGRVRPCGGCRAHSRRGVNHTPNRHPMRR